MLSAAMNVNLVTFCEDAGPQAYQWATSLPFSAIRDSLKLLKDCGFPKDKVSKPWSHASAVGRCNAESYQSAGYEGRE